MFEQDEFTRAVISCPMMVHRTLGAGFLESIYQNALQIAFRQASWNVKFLKHLQVCYHHVAVGDFDADILDDGAHILELKSASALSKADKQPLVNPHKTTGKESGLILNLGTPSLEFKRKSRTLQNPVNPR